MKLFILGKSGLTLSKELNLYGAYKNLKANDYPNSACSVGVVRFVNGIEQDSVYSLIKPPKMYFKPEYVNIHHISCGDDRT